MMPDPCPNGPDSQCPCNRTKKLAKNCCWREGRWVVVPEYARTGVEPKSPTYQNPRCYARELRACHKRISDEHAIAESAVRALGDVSAGITINGRPGMTVAEPITLAELGEPTLCHRHNGMLSPFDDVLKRLTEIMRGVAERDQFAIFNGADVERALLKAFCGELAAGHILGGDGKVVTGEPRKEWVELLFGKGPLPKGFGLFVRAPQPPGVVTTLPAFQIGPLIRGDGALAGCRFVLTGLTLDLSLVNELKLNSDELFAYRPQSVTFNATRTTTVFFYWPEGATQRLEFNLAT